MTATDTAGRGSLHLRSKWDICSLVVSRDGHLEFSLCERNILNSMLNRKNRDKNSKFSHLQVPQTPHEYVREEIHQRIRV